MSYAIGGQEAPRVTSNLIKLRVGECKTLTKLDFILFLFFFFFFFCIFFFIFFFFFFFFFFFTFTIYNTCNDTEINIIQSLHTQFDAKLFTLARLVGRGLYWCVT